jgi:hypothetical protein
MGWPECEGFCPSPPPKAGLTEPVFEYPHSGGSEATTGCAVLGGYVVRDPSLTNLIGRYLYGDLCRSDLRTLNLGVPGGDPRPAGVSIPSGELRGFGEDSRGCVYVATTANVYRLAPSADAGAACPLSQPPQGASRAQARLHLAVKAGGERLRRHVTVLATCDASCTLSATGGLRTSRATSSALCASSVRCRMTGGGLRAHELTAAPGVPTVVRLTLAGRAFRNAKHARRAGRKVRAAVRVYARDSSGDEAVATASLALR